MARESYPKQNPAYLHGGNEQILGNPNSMYHQQIVLQHR